jgi:hypothetical protein
MQLLSEPAERRTPACRAHKGDKRPQGACLFAWLLHVDVVHSRRQKRT